MKSPRNIISRLFSKRSTPSIVDEKGFDFEEWNRIGRVKAQRVCSMLEGIIDRGESTEEDFSDDARTGAFADAVLGEVVALNKAGQWQLARARFDPAHQPFISHMSDIGLHAVVVLDTERFLVRLGDEVLHIDGGKVARVEGASMFAISRNRRWLVMATDEGLAISAGLDRAAQTVTAWPEGMDVEPATVRSLEIADDGRSAVVASDEFGIWLARDGVWTLLAPRPGQNGEDEDEEGAEASGDGVRDVGTDDCPIYIGSYADIKARFGGPLGIDASHAALSPDGRHVAYGWQDAWGGHYVDRVSETTVEPLGRIETHSDYPCNIRFTDDSKQVLSNSRHLSNGITICRDLTSLDAAEEPFITDEYLRAHGLTQLPGTKFGLEEPVIWIGGAGWSHAAPLRGGKPVFTHLLGSALRAFDFDPASGRVAVGSASGVLHVLDPFTEAEPGRARGYHPRHELFRWIFWETLDAPIRW